jgi:hypothetical protein
MRPAWSTIVPSHFPAGEGATPAAHATVLARPARFPCVYRREFVDVVQTLQKRLCVASCSLSDELRIELFPLCYLAIGQLPLSYTSLEDEITQHRSCGADHGTAKSGQDTGQGTIHDINTCFHAGQHSRGVSCIGPRMRARLVLHAQRPLSPWAKVKSCTGPAQSDRGRAN